MNCLLKVYLLLACVIMAVMAHHEMEFKLSEKSENIIKKYESSDIQKCFELGNRKDDAVCRHKECKSISYPKELDKYCTSDVDKVSVGILKQLIEVFTQIYPDLCENGDIKIPHKPEHHDQKTSTKEEEKKTSTSAASQQTSTPSATNANGNANGNVNGNANGNANNGPLMNPVPLNGNNNSTMINGNSTNPNEITSDAKKLTYSLFAVLVVVLGLLY